MIRPNLKISGEYHSRSEGAVGAGGEISVSLSASAPGTPGRKTSDCKELDGGGKRGFTLIELLVGMSVLLVVGLMAAQLFGSSIRMYHSTIFYSDVQTESQAVCRRLEDAVMNAKNIYLRTSAEWDIFFTGEPVGSADSVTYEGPLFWFNRKTGCLYQKSGAVVKLGDAGGKGVNDTQPRNAGTREDINLDDSSVAALREVMEKPGNLISDKVKSIEFTISPELSDENLAPGKEDEYILDQKVTIGFEMTFHYLDSGDYPVRTGATPRNPVGNLRWPKKPA